MEINRSNYEIFFLDYFEGSLNEDQLASLMSFLEKNPDLKEEFNSFEMVEISEKPSIAFPDKFMLKVPETNLPVNEDNFEWFCIASLEQDLNSEEEQALQSYIKKNPEKKRDFELYTKTILSPSEEIVFEKPQTLKRFQTTPFLLTKQLWTYASAAAVVFIIAGLFFMMPQQKSDYEQTIAESIKPIDSAKPKEDVADVSVAETVTEAEVITPQTTSVAEITDAPAVKKDADDTPSTFIPERSSEAPAPLLAANVQNRLKNTQLGQPQYNNIQPEQRPAEPLSTAGQTQTASHPATEPEAGTTSLTSFALAELQDRTGINVPEGISRDRFSAWDLAGAGLARISNVTGTPLTVEQERNERGRIVQFALGDNFSFSRR